ncbi:polymer-forming cytoskeletal protein [Parvibaculum sp.]|uniref:bactofilin family protein n=1 Tax=Parvibaculum sp. TaxID=2024848 RepID=UPI003210F9AB
MFKRPKDTPDSKPTEDRSPPGGTRIVEKTARTEGDASSANRAVTPAYEIRKPAVRTLQSFSSSSANATPANLHVGRGLKLEGKIESCDSLVIEGDVQATIESGTLTISETGEVRGEATVDQAEIQGRFDGTLVVRKCLTINSTGKVTGTIRYGELKVEQGGRLTGQIEAADAGAGSGTRPSAPAASPVSRSPVESPE